MFIRYCPLHFSSPRWLGAAVNEAKALAQMGQIFADREEWRDALNVDRFSLAAAEDPALRKTYDELREKYGFRVLDYKIDNESASPRVCFHFSEDLLRSGNEHLPERLRGRQVARHDVLGGGEPKQHRSDAEGGEQRRRAAPHVEKFHWCVPVRKTRVDRAPKRRSSAA